MIRKSLVALVALGAAAFALPAAAQVNPGGFYVGGTIGQSKAKDACTDLAGTGINCEDSDTAWKILAGYQFNRNFAAEAGYANLGKASASALGLTDEIKSTALELSLIGSYPVMERLSIFGRLGVYSADVKEDTNFVGSFSHTNNDLTYGFGVRYDVTQSFAVRGEWQRYNDVGGGDIGKSDVDVVGLTAIWSF